MINLTFEYIKKLKKLGSENLTPAYKIVLKIAKAAKGTGGSAFLVGGCVRDMILGQTSKDFDLEVYKLQPQEVEKIVKQFGKISDVGKSFGILKISFGEGIEIDVSLPRTDSKIGAGHKGFDVNTDPYMSLDEAASRRDFTINSMAFDPLTDKLYDPFNGLKDLNKKILRVTNHETFGDDPLRVLRALQFVARFELEIEQESKKIIQGMLPQLKELPKERILEEWKKLFLKSEKPSAGLSAGMELGVFKEIHKELLTLLYTPQDSLWHPEGNVWIHTLKCIDCAIKIVKRESLGDKIAFVIMLAVLCHDLGKPFTTTVKDDRIVSPEHENAGEKPTRAFLNSIGADKFTKSKVIPLVKNHLSPFALYDSEFKRGEKITDGTIRRLATRLYPATIYELILIAEADYLGKGNRTQIRKTKKFKTGQWLLERSKTLNVQKDKPADIIQGKDLIAKNFTPSKNFGVIIHLANKLRDEKNFTKEQILKIIADCDNEDSAINKLDINLKMNKRK
ncbi:MAG: CCA tRNA nucleotidyltransferase [Candidatus Cloacimonetes bacterium]|nr:CCA tRNA nucleotidyltransferase [Candidatus Cloacimonadota bacterium]